MLVNKCLCGWDEYMGTCTRVPYIGFKSEPVNHRRLARGSKTTVIFGLASVRSNISHVTESERFRAANLKACAETRSRAHSRDVYIELMKRSQKHPLYFYHFVILFMLIYLARIWSFVDMLVVYNLHKCKFKQVMTKKETKSDPRAAWKYNKD